MRNYKDIYNLAVKYDVPNVLDVRGQRHALDAIIAVDNAQGMLKRVKFNKQDRKDKALSLAQIFKDYLTYLNTSSIGSGSSGPHGSAYSTLNYKVETTP